MNERAAFALTLYVGGLLGVPVGIAASAAGVDVGAGLPGLLLVQLPGWFVLDAGGVADG